MCSRYDTVTTAAMTKDIPDNPFRDLYESNTRFKLKAKSQLSEDDKERRPYIQ